MKESLTNTLPAPTWPDHIPIDAQWLSGEGAGSWFSIEKYSDNYIITRYSPEGKMECKGIFEKVGNGKFLLNHKYEFTYISHCSMVTIYQLGIFHKFNLIEKCAI